MYTRAGIPLRLRLLVGIFALIPLSSGAAENSQRVKYAPPKGFAGHLWGELRSNFARLPDQPRGVGAAWMNPVLTDQRITCIGICDANQVMLSLWEKHEGGGFYVLSEYAIEGQGFQYGADDRVKFHPVVYQFCANWDSTKKVPPPNIDYINWFCGVKLMFQSETREQLAKLPADYKTNYDRVLEKLLARFGRPAGFMRRGKVIIETLEGESTNAGDRKFSIYRWCPALDRRLHTSCTASVVLSLDPAKGVGTVLYSTPLLWEFAYAREQNHKGDPLFKMLHARK
ncbi:MAG TPA: hypothetical protein VGO61_13275 [Steroidobacteraceae bacterium]|jgi:hypothetical protein|nr:hypothetical protein [Steroidobacteraceae bacterium]